MAFETTKIPAGGGGFFKPSDHLADVAILVEVTRFQPQRPGSSFGPKDAVHANLTIFKDTAALDGGTPEVRLGAIIDATCLVRDLETLVGKATIAKVAMAPPTKAGHKPAAVFREVEASVQEKVVAYATARDEALAAAIADAPSFEDD